MSIKSFPINLSKMVYNQWYGKTRFQSYYGYAGLRYGKAVSQSKHYSIKMEFPKVETRGPRYTI